jgi:Lon protease-like protein
VKTTDLPLFPLRTVLVPGGLLSLQIFEPRYLDLVRECARNDSGFGVCLILEGSESGAPPQHAGIGTSARIRDFNTLPNGLLGIVASGDSRFRIHRTRVRDNGLMIGKVEWLFEAPRRTVPDEYLVLAQVLERLMEKVGGNYPGWDGGLLEDCNWVGYRLTELLPLDPLEKQSLLGLEDPELRLQRLLERLPDFQRAGV